MLGGRAANSCPFCSREIFFAAEVVPLKNASQFALIWAAALESPADADADDAGADDDGAELVEAELLELLQAVTAEANAIPSAAARIIRRATSRNRMMRLLWSRSDGPKAAGRSSQRVRRSAETQSSLAAVGVRADTGRTRLRCGSGALLRCACLYGWPGGPAPHHENG